MSMDPLELAACTPMPLDPDRFNPHATLPCGCTAQHVQAAMNEFLEFLGYINIQLNAKGIPRLETMLMAANFSSMVGEFVKSSIPRYCKTIVRNRYHNGHPDLIPTNTYLNNRVQHAHDGMEIKASRYLRGWQGHNPEATWLLVFVFRANNVKNDPDDQASEAPIPFQFLRVLGAQLEENDWTFAGRSATSRRTITASVNRSGYLKMAENWIYDGQTLLKK